MMQQNKGIKTAAQLSMWAFVVLGYLFGGFNLLQGEWSRALLGFASVFFLLVPPLMKRLGAGHPYRLYCVFFLFCILAYDIGCVIQRFDNWLHYDKISHFLSGIVFTAMGYCLYYYISRPLPKTIRENPARSSSYALFFSAFVAVSWEVCEFSGYLLTGHDSQHHLTTGVFDTMGDLIACLGGSLLAVAAFALYLAKGIKLITPLVAEEFLEVLHRNRSSQ